MFGLVGTVGRPIVIVETLVESKPHIQENMVISKAHATGNHDCRKLMIAATYDSYVSNAHEKIFG
jgi:hypothetical protein